MASCEVGGLAGSGAASRSLLWIRMSYSAPAPLENIASRINLRPPSWFASSAGERGRARSLVTAKAASDPDDEEHEMALEMLGEDWDPEELYLEDFRTILRRR